MLNRPFKNASIDEIENAFQRFAGNRTTLIHIRDELKIRETRFAKALLKDVEKALGEQEPSIEQLVEDVVADNRSLDPRSAQARAAQVKIAELRQRLLDLSNRNRLINFKHGSRGGRQIRIVSEWLPKLYSILEGDKPVELVNLPPLPHEPEDEQEPEFVSVLEEAIITDKAYLKALEKIEDEADDKAEFSIAKAERALRDRLRKKLGWPTRAEVSSISIAEHAKRIGVDPSYELNNPSPRRGKRRVHQWQTLLTEDELERRMRALEHQSRESREEYGVETLYLVVGFLEWLEKTPGGESEAPNLSPLLLVPLSIEKRQPGRMSRTVDDRWLIDDGEGQSTSHRDIYTIQGGADEVSVNLCLRERLRQECGIELPEWNDELGAEAFLGQVAQAIADRPGWKVRFYATISHLTFSRLAMWVDLDPEKTSAKPPHVHPVLGELFGGGGVKSDRDGDGAPDDDIEAGVPSLIMDCDSSQFAAIRAALGGRNMTIQGPPGTGKSQTIANLIASLLHQGKSVLFVAEKMAALDVVHSRLTDAGIGDFLLELHSAKAAKKAVLESIRRRLRRPRRSDWEVSGLIAIRRKELRDKLNAYSAAINSTFGASGLTIHELIWQSYAYRDKPVPDHLAGYRLDEVGAWDKEAIEVRCRALVQRTELDDRYRAEKGCEEHPWSWVENSDLHVEECDRLYHHVLDLLAKLEEIHDWIGKIQLVSFPFSLDDLRALSRELASLGERPSELKSGLWELALQDNVLRTVETVVDAHNRRREAEQVLLNIAPGLLETCSDEGERIANFAKLAAQLIPSFGGSISLGDLESKSLRNRQLLDLLDSAIELTAQLRAVFTWDNVSEAELIATARFIDLASKAPANIISKRHALGDDGQTTLLREKLVAMESCEKRVAELSGLLKVQIEALDHPMLVRHRDELLKSGPFAFFRKLYREAAAFCRNAFPTVEKDARLPFLANLCDLVALRNRLVADESMHAAAGDLYAGWSTGRESLRDCCDWIDSVRQQTPIIEKHATKLRGILFNLSQDQAALAKKLKAESWDERFTAIGDQCRRRSVSLNEVRASIQNEQAVLAEMTEALLTLGWKGPLSNNSLKEVSTAGLARKEASEVIELKPRVLELLLPDPQAAIACVRSIVDTRLRVQKLPIQPAWRGRLVGSNSVSDWVDFSSHVTALKVRLDLVHQVANRLFSLAGARPRYRETCERLPISAWTEILRGSAQAEKMLLTRAQLLASIGRVETLGLQDLLSGARGPAMNRFDGITDLFRAVYLRSMVFQAFEQHECLAEFRHESPAVARLKFSKLDHELKLLHRQQLIEELMARTPPAGVDTGLIKERSELGLLSHVAHLEKPRTSVRDLLRRAGRALQALKPCFMMSPLSVAQLIERGKLNFDVVIFDEASQVRPEDAMSAMARSRQFVVVGDQMQLPPTSFGEKAFNDEPLDDEEGAEVEESAAVESILQLASASYGNGRTLLWHYRSRDPSLIAFSNKEFYRNELLLFPCPSAKNQSTGVKYVWVGGHYSARTNAEEAKTCAKAAIEFMRQSRDRSLGIVALNRPQADLIQLELDRLIHEDEDAAKYQAKWADGLEPLFVKNLENVQGDERDVIFISTVFGDDESGRFFQRFGPINSIVGHRRLNVLFTRAKFQLVLFTSLPTEKIQLSNASHWGVRALKEYLDYARTGRIERGVTTGGVEDSPFEVAVRGALESAGFQCEPQVGIAGFFVDLGVRHPRFPEHFLAGIECDGAAYHSTRSARDRDRLRQHVLESFGWKIYRVWSTDWFADPHGQLEKLIVYLEKLKAVPIEAVNRHGLDFSATFGKPRTISVPEVEGSGAVKK